jgi:general secretion pathway protein L
MLSEFLAWWAQQMLGLLPERLIRRDGGLDNALIVTRLDHGFGEPEVEFTLRRNRRETAVGRFTLDETGLRAARTALGNRYRGLPLVLSVPRSAILERQINLPLAAERDLARVVQYEMDRFTPFAADEVFFAVAVQRRDRVNAKLQALVSLVPKAQLEQLLAALGQLDVTPSVLEARLPGDGFRRVELGQPDPRRGRWQRAAFGLAAAACVLLALTAAGLPFLQQSWQLDEVEAEIEALRPRVNQAEALRKQIASDTSGSDVIASEGARVGDALQTIATLTEILPDDTYLTALTLRTRKLTLEGQSAAAAKLIAALSADPTIKDASFAAPVTRTTTGADIFSIRAELGP